MAVNSTVKEPTDSWAMYVMTQKHLAFNLKWCIPDSLSDWAEHGSAASNSLSSSYKEDVDGDELPCYVLTISESMISGVVQYDWSCIFIALIYFNFAPIAEA